MYLIIWKIDRVWERDRGYHYYDFNKPENLDKSLHHTFDVVVIDPPFITRDVWELYSKTARLLLKYSPYYDNETSNGDDSDGNFIENQGNQMKPKGFVVTTTVAENEFLMYELFRAKPTIFKPSIPHLVYQYEIYINYTEGCSLLGKKNPEIPDC